MKATLTAGKAQFDFPNATIRISFRLKCSCGTIGHHRGYLNSNAEVRNEVSAYFFCYECGWTWQPIPIKDLLIDDVNIHTEYYSGD